MPQAPPHTKGRRNSTTRPIQGLNLWITLCSKMGHIKTHSDKPVYKNIKTH